MILGIDPGLANTGWGAIECEGARMRCLGYGCFTTDPEDEQAERLRAVHEAVAAVVASHHPDECAIESVYFSSNVRTAFATGQARGAALVALAAARVRVGEYGPGEVKMAVTGNGSADKRQVAYMVRAVLGLSEEPRPDHAADALAIALCHAATLGVRRAGGAAPSRAGEAGRGERASGWEAAVERAERRDRERREAHADAPKRASGGRP